MRTYPSDIAFTESVKALQEADGSRDSYAQMETRQGWNTKVTPELTHFLSQLDMFYLATSNGEGQPYIQYRGGPPGFLNVVDENTLGFADFAGNRQFISTGNLQENSKAFIFLIDYVNRRRIKLWGNARIVEDDELLNRLRDPDYPARPERVVLFSIEAWDVNCPQHIHPRYPESKIQQLRAKIADLESQLAEAKSASLA